MAAKSKKIAKVVSLARSDERRIGEQTGRCLRVLEENNKKLGELNAYRQGYAGQSPTSDTLHAAHLRDYQSFLRRLDIAIKSQQQIVRDSEVNLKLHRERWMAKRQKLESLQRVLERHTEHERLQLERLEQKRLDDLPNRMATPSSSDGDG